MDVIFTCTAEDQSRYAMRVENLLLSIRAFGGASRDAPVVVNVVDSVTPSFKARVENLGGEVRLVERVAAGPPPANKLRMLECDHGGDVVVGLDCDVVVLGDVSIFAGTAIRAKRADTNPFTTKQWARLLAAIELEVGLHDWVPTMGGTPMPVHFNTGVLFMPTEVLGEHRLAERWMAEIVRIDAALRRRPWIVPRPLRFFMEQLAFGFTLVRHSIPFEEAPVSANCPTHLPLPDNSLADPPLILHYHHGVSDDGFLTLPRTPGLAAHVERFNLARAEALGLEYHGPPVPPSSAHTGRARRAAQRARGLARRLVGR
jgi:hypothetical protein